MPDEERGLIYVSTCDDGRPIESSHFMVYDTKKKTYRDLGDSEHSYAFTVVTAADGKFSVSLIPETLARTTLGLKQPGDVVNLEVDVIAKYVEKMVQK